MLEAGRGWTRPWPLSALLGLRGLLAMALWGPEFNKKKFKVIVAEAAFRGQRPASQTCVASGAV